MHGKPKSVCLALIHNNDAQRNAYLCPKLSELSEALSPEYEVDLVEIYEQPDLETATRPVPIRRDIAFQILLHKYRAYSGRPSRIVSLATRIVRTAVKRRVFETGAKRRAREKQVAIEGFITDKHFRAWDRFLELGSDILICFEDDAVFNEDSPPAMREAIGFAEREFAERRYYGDLGGGYPLERLGIDGFVSSSSGRIKVIEKPFTNTLCAYMLNKACAQDFTRRIAADPSLRMLPCDWAVNAMMFDMAARDEEPAKCFHTDPTVFLHGSANGTYSAWRHDVPAV